MTNPSSTTLLYQPFSRVMMGETNTREVKCNIERTSLQWKKEAKCNIERTSLQWKKDIVLVVVSKKIKNKEN